MHARPLCLVGRCRKQSGHTPCLTLWQASQQAGRLHNCSDGLLTGIGGMDLTILYRTHPAPPTTAALPNCTGRHAEAEVGAHFSELVAQHSSRCSACNPFGCNQRDLCAGTDVKLEMQARVSPPQPQSRVCRCLVQPPAPKPPGAVQGQQGQGSGKGRGLLALNSALCRLKQAPCAAECQCCHTVAGGRCWACVSS